MAIVTLGIDLAKNVFALHGVDATGRAVLVRPRMATAKPPDLVASLPRCPIGLEASSGAYHGHGHTVRADGAQARGALSPLGQARQEQRGEARRKDVLID